MNRFLAIVLLVTCSSVIGAIAQTPQATDLPGKPFFIKKTWIIGGEGNWDYLTMDPKTMQLFIPHGRIVQVVDVNTGQVVGQVTGLRDAHSVALDEEGQYGFVTDGGAASVIVFDRSSYQVIARIPTANNPRAAVFDASTGLVFAVCPDTTPEANPQRRGQSPSRRAAPEVQSTITVIDPQSHKRLADVLVPNQLGFAQADGRGTVYINDVKLNHVIYLHTQTVVSQIQNGLQRMETGAKANNADGKDNASDGNDGTDKHRSETRDYLVVDWTPQSQQSTDNIPNQLHSLSIGGGCVAPHGLAIDAADNRLFVACENMRMVVLNTEDGSQVTTLPIGAGNDALGFDADRGLIYASNGGGVGSLTIIRRDVVDTYHVIQELPTQARARTLAVNPDNGNVYLVTNVVGFDLNHDGGIGGLQTAAVPGSFRVLVVGN
ncbi:YncE family protein [Acidicapsa dinghuensis]|uniref:YncE family protein n=1 Tax=Acidicapsa dinghuensis TaxID=2218256 RepID=A0ABW1EEI9_9BACT|nr:hypothetical protein [Acidicapsa dinghuensis]